MSLNLLFTFSTEENIYHGHGISKAICLDDVRIRNDHIGISFRLEVFRRELRQLNELIERVLFEDGDKFGLGYDVRCRML